MKIICLCNVHAFLKFKSYFDISSVQKLNSSNAAKKHRSFAWVSKLSKYDIPFEMNLSTFFFRLLMEYEEHLRNTLEKGMDAESYSLHTFEALLTQSMENLGKLVV